MISRLLKQILFSGLLLLLYPNPLLADWHWRNPAPQGNTLTSIACGDAGCVAAGINGAAILSNDGGMSWTSHNQNQGTIYESAIAYGNGTWVSVNGYKSVSSVDGGITWTTIPALAPYSLYGITYQNGTFVAVGWSGTILTSSDGTTWTSRTSGTTQKLAAVAFGGGTFVAVGNNGTVVTSTNATTWSVKPSGGTVSLSGVAYGNGTFVAVGGFGAGPIVSKDNGNSWTAASFGQPLYGSYQYAAMNAVAYGNGMFLAAGQDGYIVSSPDGTSWTPLSTSQMGMPFTELKAIAFSGSTAIVVGEGGLVITSPDGSAWTKRAGDFLSAGLGNAAFQTVTYGNGVFMAAGNSIAASTDGGRTWTPRNAPPGLFYGSTFGDGIFMEAGYWGAIFTSTDNGNTWTSRTSGTGNQLNAVDFDPGDHSFWAVGKSNTIIRSLDGGATWNSMTAAVPASVSQIRKLYGISAAASAGPDWNDSRDCTSGGGYTRNRVIVGDGGTIAVSDNGGFPSPVSSGVTEDLKAVNEEYSAEHLGGKTYDWMIAVGNNCTILISTDCGKTWIKYGVPFCSNTNFSSAFYHSTDVNNPLRPRHVSIAGSDGQWHDLVTPTTPPYTTWTFDGQPMNPVSSQASANATVSPRILSTSSPTTVDSTHNANPLYGVVGGNGTLVAVGKYGTILQSDPVDSCGAATLSSPLGIHIPYLNLNGSTFSLDLQYAQGPVEGILFELANYGLVNPADFSNCQGALLFVEGSEIVLHVPVFMFNNVSYWVDLVYVPTTDGNIWVKAKGFGTN